MHKLNQMKLSLVWGTLQHLARKQTSHRAHMGLSITQRNTAVS